jgi:hypothetical protein
MLFGILSNMLNQTFTPNELKRLISDSDIEKLKLGSNEIDVMSSITSISYRVSQPSFSFSKIVKKIYKNRNVYSTEDKSEFIALKKLNFVIKRLYKLSYSNRNEILNQVISILNDGSNYSVIRADIKDFFETVPRKSIFKKLKSDSLLGSLMINKLNQFDKSLSDLSCSYLPRGISLSSTLSELYLRSFDQIIKNHIGVYYYARYVDDIIIICLDDVNGIESILRQSLDDLGLDLNHKFKAIRSTKTNDNFEYLGVDFNFSSKAPRYRLSQNKVKKLKTRIIKAILDYRNNKNNLLLIDRIKFLTSNYKLYTKTHSNNLKAGIYYSNPHINEYVEFNELNEFLRKSFTAKKGSLAKTIKVIPKDVVSQCLKKCFFKGYIDKEMIQFNASNFSSIMECWKNE